MQLLANIPDTLRQRRFDVHVHVFETNIPIELVAFDVRLDCLKTRANLPEFSIREHADFRQHACMGDGTLNIVAIQAFVEIYRSSESLHEFIHGFAKPAAPEFAVVIFVLAHAFACGFVFEGPDNSRMKNVE